MNTREVATRLVALRRMLIRGVLVEPGGVEWLALQRQFTRQVRRLPWLVQWQHQARVVEPAARKLDREGILAQNPGATGRGRMAE